MLRSLQQVYGARKIRDYTIIDAPPFFETAGTEESAESRNQDTMDEGAVSDAEERDRSVFWGDNKGPVVMVWDGLNRRGKKINGLQRIPLEEGSLGGKDGIIQTISERQLTLGTWRSGFRNRGRATLRRVSNRYGRRGEMTPRRMNARCNSKDQRKNGGQSLKWVS